MSTAVAQAGSARVSRHARGGPVQHANAGGGEKKTKKETSSPLACDGCSDQITHLPCGDGGGTACLPHNQRDTTRLSRARGSGTMTISRALGTRGYSEHESRRRSTPFASAGGAPAQASAGRAPCIYRTGPLGFTLSISFSFPGPLKKCRGSIKQTTRPYAPKRPSRTIPD